LSHLIGTVAGDPWPVRVHRISAAHIALVLSRPLLRGTLVPVELFNADLGQTWRLLARVTDTHRHPSGELLANCTLLQKLGDGALAELVKRGTVESDASGSR